MCIDTYESLAPYDTDEDVWPTPSAVLAGFAANEPAVTLASEAPSTGFGSEFRREVVALVFDVLARAYGPHREYVADEARKRNVPAELLLATHLMRVVLEKVERGARG